MFRHSLLDSEEEILSGLGSNKNSPAQALIPRFNTPGSNKNSPAQALIPRFNTPGLNKNSPAQAAIPRFFTPFQADISRVDASISETDEEEKIFSSCPDIGLHFSPSILT